MELNTKKTMRLSLNDIEEYKNMLMEKKKQLPQIAENIVRKISEIGLEDNYNSAEIIPIENTGGIVSGGIRTTEEKDTYKEFGTGIVGSNNPHVIEYLAEVGWKYDVNEHGEKGWVYPKEDGSFAWTKGMPAQQKFYGATIRMEENLLQIAKEEFNK